MAAATVRVDDAVKEELDRLQAHLQAETGEVVSQGALIGRLVRFARHNEAVFIAEREPSPWEPPTPDQLAVLLDGVEDWGVDTDASQIDQELYGDDA